MNSDQNEESKILDPLEDEASFVFADETSDYQMSRILKQKETKNNRDLRSNTVIKRLEIGSESNLDSILDTSSTNIERIETFGEEIQHQPSPDFN